jgi:DNA ligase-1
MAKREFLMLAHPYKPAKYGIGGWYMSEKLDGMRCFWDGGITRGVAKCDVPWANQDKDGRYVTKPIATGLWSRYGNVIHAPESWLDELPAVPMDGELYAGLDHRQALMSTIKKLDPDEADWANVKYHVFDLPSLDSIFSDGVINNTGFKKSLVNVQPWVWARQEVLTYKPKPETIFKSTIFLINKHCSDSPVCVPLEQEELPYHTSKAQARLEEKLDEVVAKGGEGLVVRGPGISWVPERSHGLLKVKHLDDMEGTVIGYTTGRVTDKGSKLLGMMGALILDIGGGRELELSGFTDMERLLQPVGDPSNQGDAYNWAAANPGVEVPESIEARDFPRGSVVSFRYRGLTRDGIPMEARYWRRRQD